MSCRFTLKDGRGRPNQAGVSEDHAVLVTVVPPANAIDLTDDQLTRRKLYNAALVDAGESSDMNVDGSVTPVEFSTTQLSEQVVHVQELRFIFHDSQLNMDSNEARRFGSAAGLGGLTNGLTGFLVQGGQQFDIIIDPIAHMGQFFTYNEGIRNVIDGIAVGTDLLVWIFQFSVDLTLPDGTLDKLTIVVNDDLTSMTLFKAVVVGWREAR